MKGRLLTVSGDISKRLRDYSLLTDLMVLKLTFPPGGSVFDRLSSGIITLLQTSRRPVLFVKEDPLVVSNILLLYDEREKSREALFISAYYAARYGCSLSIGIPSKEGSASVKSMDFAHEYVSALGVQFESCFLDQEKIEQELPVLIEQKQFSTVIMGGYESGGLLDRIFASNVDKVLEIADVPVLVCQ